MVPPPAEARPAAAMALQRVRGGDDAGSSRQGSLPAELLDTSRFFNSLVQLVPPKYYLDPEHEHLDLAHMKKDEKAAAKLTLRAAHKANKRAKLDPDAKATTLAEQQRRAAAKRQRRDDGSDGEEDAEVSSGSDDEVVERKAAAATRPGLRLNIEPGSAPSKEQLRARLQRKIEAYRAKRHAEAKERQVAKTVEWRDRKQGRLPPKKQNGNKRGVVGVASDGDGQPTKRALVNASAPALPAAGAATAIGAAGGSLAMQPRGKKEARSESQQLAADTADLAFGLIDMGGPQTGGKPQRKHRKKSKADLLRDAEAKAVQRAAAATTTEVRAAAAAGAWRDAVARAKGEKVYDDPTRLRRSMKKEAKAKAKRAMAWAERSAAQKQLQTERQQKRTENLTKRAEAGAEKKKAKREKKLLRAGFEGRRESFIGAKK